MAEVITVSALNRYVKMMLESSEELFDLALRGEVANFRRNAQSGHCYFSLRDEQSSVRAVMWRSDARRLAFQPEDGMRVVVRCRVTLYERDGTYQVVVTEIFPDGIGSAQMAFEQLKARLEAEGLFDPALKKPLPAEPRCIGLVTSKTGAALQDIRNVLARRWPLVKVLLYPVSVQGIEAAGQIAEAIRKLDECGLCDVLIVARGGGSREDLWVFNAESIARAAFACKTPLISAIGHEIDFTILDFVADERAPTPSAAAELAVPDRQEMLQKIYKSEQNIYQNMQKRLQVCYNELEGLAQQRYAMAIRTRVEQNRSELSTIKQAISVAARRRAQTAAQRLSHGAALAASLSPYRTLARGYALAEDDKGTPVRVDELRPGQRIRLRGAARAALCTVDAMEEDPHEKTEKL